MSRQTTRTTEVITKLKKEFPDAFKSGYSGENSKEFYAEMFTEYYRTSGATTNPLVQAMATEFGWKVPGGVVQPKPIPVPVETKPVKKVEFKDNVAKHNDLQDWNINEVWKLSQIKDSPSTPVKIWDGGANEYITIYRQVGDPRLKAILQAQGFTVKPTIVSATEFETLAKTGGTKIYRGVTPTETKTASSMIDDFKDGDMFVGTGVIGNGVYAGTDLSYVIKYAGDKPENVIEMILSPNAKVITKQAAEEGARDMAGAFYDAAFGRTYRNPELGKIVDEYIASIGGLPTTPLSSTPAGLVIQGKLRNMGWLNHEPGAYAALRGYDAIKHVDDDGGVFVILNRGAVVVKE
jgi:hypothetical protein